MAGIIVNTRWPAPRTNRKHGYQRSARLGPFLDSDCTIAANVFGIAQRRLREGHGLQDRSAASRYRVRKA